MQTIRFPVANITKIAFGGPDLRTAYATTAAKGLSSEERTAQPLAGACSPSIPVLPGRRAFWPKYKNLRERVAWKKFQKARSIPA
jgi:hypothetical protein